MKGPAFSQGQAARTDGFMPEQVGRLNETYINQKEDQMERFEVGGTGWRSGQQQVYAQ
jgi:hypothetical protein